MEESIVSIYDLLLKRQRQLRRQQIQDTTVVVGAVNETTTTTTTTTTSNSVESEKSNIKPVNRTRVTYETRPRANVISASHLTRQTTGSLLPTLTKKEVLDKLVARMMGGGPKRVVQATSSSVLSSGQPTETPSVPAPVDTSKKVRNVRAPTTGNVEGSTVPQKKVKKPKPKISPKTNSETPTVAGTTAAVPSKIRRRQALSPRNNLSNTLSTKRDRNIKAKSPINLNITNADSAHHHSNRPQRRSKFSKSKMENISDLDRISTSDESNAVCYRL